MAPDTTPSVELIRSAARVTSTTRSVAVFSRPARSTSLASPLSTATTASSSIFSGGRWFSSSRATSPSASVHSRSSFSSFWMSVMSRATSCHSSLFRGWLRFRWVFCRSYRSRRARARASLRSARAFLSSTLFCASASSRRSSRSCPCSFSRSRHAAPAALAASPVHRCTTFRHASMASTTSFPWPSGNPSLALRCATACCFFSTACVSYAIEGRITSCSERRLVPARSSWYWWDAAPFATAPSRKNLSVLVWGTGMASEGNSNEFAYAPALACSSTSIAAAACFSTNTRIGFSSLAEGTEARNRLITRRWLLGVGAGPRAFAAPLSGEITSCATTSFFERLFRIDPRLLRIDPKLGKATFFRAEPWLRSVADDAAAVLPEHTDMPLLLPPSAMGLDRATGRLRRAPSASLREYVPLGDSAFFLGDVRAPLLEEAPLPLGERLLGERSPNGDRLGDCDRAAGLRLGLGHAPLGFSLAGDPFRGERLRDDRPRMGDMDLPPAAFWANEFSREVRMGLQLSPSIDSSAIPLDDEEEMCDVLRLAERRPGSDGRERRARPAFERGPLLAWVVRRLETLMWPPPSALGVPTLPREGRLTLLFRPVFRCSIPTLRGMSPSPVPLFAGPPIVDQLLSEFRPSMNPTLCRPGPPGPSTLSSVSSLMVDSRGALECECCWALTNSS
ncbi:hypothetical protein ACHAXT_003048 [Thalassiosira profunda]